MKVGLISDLHFEFQRDSGRSLVNHILPDGCDVLVVAGDLTVGAELVPALKMLCEQYREVVYVPGNHEYYRMTRGELRKRLHTFAGRHKNFHWLDNSSVVLGGHRFLGGTMWFRHDPVALKDEMWDFRLIPELESWVYQDNAATLTFFQKEVQEGDIVVTHHLPSPRSTPEQYKEFKINPFFVCNMEELILAKKPAIWMHGHTHGSFDYRLGDTRVLCNPFGYARKEENPKFNFELTVTV